MSLVFGVTSTGGYGVLQSLSETETAEIAEARDAGGKVTDMKAYSKTKEASADFLFDDTDVMAGAGTSLQVGSVTGLITSISKSEENTGYKKGTVTVQTKDSATLAAYA